MYMYVCVYIYIYIMIIIMKVTAPTSYYTRIPSGRAQLHRQRSSILKTASSRCHRRGCDTCICIYK